MIYLDNNATTRVHPEALEAMLPYFSEAYFNPTSAAGALYDVRRPLLEARESLAHLINCSPDELVLTSGATESNNWVLQSIARRAVRETGKCHLVVSAIEHPSVLEVAQFLSESDPSVEVDYAPVKADGVLDLEAFKKALRNDTQLVSLMWANNESGVIQPVTEAAKLAKCIAPQSIFHTDATQVVGKIVVSLGDRPEIDCLSLSAHKFYGPKGIGALFIRAGLHLDPMLHGGGQQGRARAGTENPALAAGLAKAAQLVRLTIGCDEVAKLRDFLESSLSNLGVIILGSLAPRLPNTSLILFPYVDSEMLVNHLLAMGIVTSSGSACSAGSDRPSHVVRAMGIEHTAASGALRVSLGNLTTTEEIHKLVTAIRLFQHN